MASNKETIVIAVDCGSASIRASLIRFVDGVLDGHPLATHKQNITIYNPITDYYEQNSNELWNCLGICIRKCLETSKVNYKQISGISFSATCSLVIIDNTNKENDVFMWMDHRAIKEAADITSTKNEVLQQMGGTCSVEFSLAKLFWLFRNRKDRFDTAQAFMELPDFFAWKCSNLDPKDYPRSVCSVVCKWGYDAVNKRWRDDLFTTLGMEEFVKDKTRIGADIVHAGTHVGYMSKQAAVDLGLLSSASEVAEDTLPISIASPIIDAHAGALSMCMFSHELKEVEDERLDYDNMWCMIGGTSTCDFISTHQRYYTQGVWGPYYDAIFPGYYVREAGQSTTGILMEHVIKAHPDYHNIHKDKPIHEVIKYLNEKLLKKPYMNRLNVNPCFHGSRLLAFPSLRGGYYGLTMDAITLKDSYHSIVEALVYESKYILDELRIPDLKKVLVSGGLAKNELYMQVCADVLDIDVLSFSLGDADLMLVGAALLAYHSIHRTDLNKKIAKYPNLETKRYKPTPELRQYHDLKYKCFREMLDSACKIETLMAAIKTRPKNHSKKNKQ